MTAGPEPPEGPDSAMTKTQSTLGPIRVRRRHPHQPAGGPTVAGSRHPRSSRPGQVVLTISTAQGAL